MEWSKYKSLHLGQIDEKSALDSPSLRSLLALTFTQAVQTRGTPAVKVPETPSLFLWPRADAHQLLKTKQEHDDQDRELATDK